jgi:hypothetical protein
MSAGCKDDAYAISWISKSFEFQRDHDHSYSRRDGWLDGWRRVVSSVGSSRAGQPYWIYTGRGRGDGMAMRSLDESAS